MNNKTPAEVAKGWGGWEKLVKKLFEDIYAIYPEFEYMQMKEKFGGLRIYSKWVPLEYNRRIQALIHEIANESYRTCEVCGSKRGRPRQGGWVRTLCKKHAEGRRLLPWKLEE